MVGMNERAQDFELLQRFARGEQSAFADVVRRHLDLVLATALRKVGDAGGAQEISQNVFSVLARKAWRFAPDDSLPAWLHKTALLESKSWLRGELRRRRREETAVELGTTMKTSEDQPAFNALVPLLDDALLSLREKDRTALLLRYYERQSLRDVGAAFGVSEDTAQKRVRSALEKLAEFFTRRGYKTASAAAAAAALQHTAATASTTLLSTIVGAALQAAPPALAGLGVLLARLASLSRAQTAAVCVALAALPVWWQLNERHAAGEEAKRLQTQLLASQNEGATVEIEIERLRALSGNLEQSVAKAREAAARAAAFAQAFDVWKKKTRGQLVAAAYRWPDDSPFVRISKPVALELTTRSDTDPFHPPGDILPCARELMGMTPSERQSVEDVLHRHIADVEELLAAGIQETNQPLSGRVVASTKFFLPDLGDEEKQRTDRMLTTIRGILGEERWPLVKVKLPEARRGNVYSSDQLSTLNQLKQNLSVYVEIDEKGTPKMGYGLGGAVATAGSRPLSMFLPEDDPKRIEGAENWLRGALSNALRQRALAWLQEQAIARLGKEAMP
jgi:RNA polymerase sigma factor (sigma-70 family)